MAERPDSIAPGSRGPGFERAPKHRVALVPRRLPIQVSVGGASIANTDDVVMVEEGTYPPRYYIARDGVDMQRLEKTDKVTYCPFKGLATYYVIRGESGNVVDAVWSYEEVYHEAELLRGRLAFDADKVEQVVTEP